MVRIALIGIACVLFSCQKRQDVYIDMAMANAALMAAKESKADIYAPFYFRKAETFLLAAKKDYSNKFFSSAKGNAGKSREFSEIAEKKSVLKQAQSGGEETSEEAKSSEKNEDTKLTNPQSTLSDDETLDEDPF